MPPPPPSRLTPDKDVQITCCVILKSPIIQLYGQMSTKRWSTTGRGGYRNSEGGGGGGGGGGGSNMKNK